MYADVDGKWKYETGLPDWAMPPPGFEGPTEMTSESDPLAVVLEKMRLEDDQDGQVSGVAAAASS
jgi:tRNA pseudouridine synthase 9